MALGGELRRECLSYVSGYSVRAQRTGNTQSYLEPIRDSMQSPIEGRSEIGKRRGEGSLLAQKPTKPMLKNQPNLLIIL